MYHIFKNQHINCLFFLFLFFVFYGSAIPLPTDGNWHRNNNICDPRTLVRKLAINKTLEAEVLFGPVLSKAQSKINARCKTLSSAGDFLKTHIFHNNDKEEKNVRKKHR